MAFEFRLADVGEGIHEVELLSWSVRPGDEVAAFQPLCQVESAKATVELTSPVAGKVLETRVPEGGTAHVGDVLVLIDPQPTTPAADTDAYFGIVGSAPAPAPPASITHSESSNPEVAARVEGVSAADVGGGVGSHVGRTADAGPGTGSPTGERAGAVRAAPLVRRLAREQGIRLEEVAGSGPQGRIRVADLERHQQQQQQAAASPVIAGAPTVDGGRAAGDWQRIAVRGVRRRMAERMADAARHVPAVTAMDSLDVSALVQTRQELLAAAEAEGARLTYLPFIVRASVEALRSVPEANAVYDEQGPAILVSQRYHIGIAVAAPAGLFVPVIKDADRRSLLELAQEITRLTAAARSQSLAPADLVGSTFTISSFGGLGTGVQFATPIVNYPEVAILGVGRIEQQPRVVDGQVVPRHCLGVSFTFDHRVLDGEQAARFLATLRRYLERPAELLLRLR